MVEVRKKILLSQNYNEIGSPYKIDSSTDITVRNKKHFKENEQYQHVMGFFICHGSRKLGSGKKPGCMESRYPSANIEV